MADKTTTANSNTLCKGISPEVAPGKKITLASCEPSVRIMSTRNGVRTGRCNT